MAKTTKKDTVNKKNEPKAESLKSWRPNKQHSFFMGCLLILLSIALLVAFISLYVN